MQATKPSSTQIQLQRAFAAPRAAVFAALTEPAHMLQWMQPLTMPLIGCDVDLRTGGSFRQTYQRPGGPSIEVRGDYETVTPPQRWVYVESYDFSPLRVHVETTLDEDDAGTLFTQTLTYTAEQERDDDFDGVAGSAAEVYSRLDSYLTKSS
jgi:uncharacterized protein YndB with AHSA1/START domain